MRKSLALLIQAPFFAMVYIACSSSPSPTDGGGPDGTTMEASTMDKKVIPDMGVQETAPGCVPATTIDTSMITWIPPTAPNPNACSDVQIPAFFAACLGTSATSTTCNAFTMNAGNSTCYKCLVSPQASTSYGVLITIGKVDYANVSGCIALLTGDASSTGCGAKNQAALDCEALACEDNCPITDSASFTAYTNCTTASDTGVCESYVSAECNLQDAGGADAAAAYQTCENHSSFQDYYDTLAPIFCGGYPSDAGVSDAATDGG